MHANANGLMVLLVRPQMMRYGKRLARRYRDVVESDEVESAVDLGLVYAAERFEPQRGAFLILAGIWVRREVMRLIRREVEWRKRRVADDEAGEPIATEGPDEIVERRQIVRLLGDHGHTVWRSHVADGRSVRELAKTLGLSIRQVQARLGRSRRRIQRLRQTLRRELL